MASFNELMEIAKDGTKKVTERRNPLPPSNKIKKQSNKKSKRYKSEFIVSECSVSGQNKQSLYEEQEESDGEYEKDFIDDSECSNSGSNYNSGCGCGCNYCICFRGNNLKKRKRKELK